jgi:hypothetical protein
MGDLLDGPDRRTDGRYRHSMLFPDASHPYARPGTLRWHRHRGHLQWRVPLTGVVVNTHRTFKSAVALCLALPLLACGPVHQWPARSAGEGPYRALGDEFMVEQPAADVALDRTARENFLAVDFVVADGLSGLQHYSVEWNTLTGPEPQTGEAFHAEWDTFLPQYLEGNFGDGRYQLLRSERGRFQDRYPMLRFAAVGRHNGGDRGSIYGTAISFGHRVAVVYVLRGNQPSAVPSFEALPGYGAYERFVQSLTCRKACRGS